MPSLLLALLCALQDPEPPKEVLIDLKVDQISQGDGRRATLRIEGTCNLPDHVQLLVAFHFAQEMVGDAGDLKPESPVPTRDVAMVVAQGFRLVLPGKMPGRQRIEVSVYKPRTQAALPEAYKNLPGIDKTWTFEYGAWENGLPAKMAERLPLLRTLISDIRTYIGTLEASTQTEDLWNEKKSNVRADGVKLAERAEQLMFVDGSLPATASYVDFVARALNEKSAGFVFEDGKLAGAWVRDRFSAPLRFDGPLYWDSYRGAMDEALKVAGREYALWTVKVLRANQDWEAVHKSLAAVKPSPELDPWLERLKTCTTVADLDVLEKDLRAPTIKVRK